MTASFITIPDYDGLPIKVRTDQTGDVHTIVHLLDATQVAALIAADVATTEVLEQMRDNPDPVAISGTVSITDLSNADYEYVAASQTAQILGATGAVGDYCLGLLIVPATTSPGNVTLQDGNGTARTIFTGGASSVSNLAPFFVPIQSKAVNETTPGWKVTTGANVAAFCPGNYT